MKRVTLHAATTATSTDAGDEKDQADGSLLSGFRSGQPSRIGSKGQTLAGPQEIGSNQGGLKIVPRIARRVIFVSVFVLLLEFNRHRSKGIRILGEGE